ncbi:MAG: DUF7718 family protein [Thermomicrobiales bacterium]
MAEQWARKHFVPVGGQNDSIRVRLTTRRGVLVYYTAQYEIWIEDDWRPAVRYDNAHGRPHRDLLDWDGRTVAKEPLPDLPPNRALAAAINEVKLQWSQFRADFLGRRR